MLYNTKTLTILTSNETIIIPELQWKPQFYEPPRETKSGSKNRRNVGEIGGKITVFDYGGKRLLVRVIEMFEKSGFLCGYFETSHTLCIVNRGGMGMKLVKVLCCMLLFCFLALTLHKTQQLFTLN